MKSLDEINAYWEKACQCTLRNSATRAVFGSGNPHARVVFIGEAPGKKEDETGVPFVGAAGKFLDEMLNTIGMKRDDIYITNIVKYRPPDNRDPEPQEKEDCKAWLYEELATIKPLLVVFLGRHSMNHFFPLEKISNVHGKLMIKQINGIPTRFFLPLYHPAAALYNGSLREELLYDFKKIPMILKKILQNDF